MIRRSAKRHVIKGALIVAMTVLTVLIFARITNQELEEKELVHLDESFHEYKNKVGRMAEILYKAPSYIKVDPAKSAFRVPSAILRKLASPSAYVTLDSQSAASFVFVTAASWPFFEEVLKTIETIQLHFPQRKIVFYDLGLTSGQQQKISTVCGLVYKYFDFTRYPDHVRNLHVYAWKPIAIYEVLQEYPGIFWVDSSARFSGWSDVIYDDVIRNNGALFLTTTGHSNFAVTHKRMYDYLPTNMEAMMQLEQRESIIMLYRTKFTYENIVFWLVMCALEKQCIAPTEGRGCRFGEGTKRYSTYANCHRFDQSAVNILMANAHNFPEGKQLYASTRIVSVKRVDDMHPTHVQYC